MKTKTKASTPEVLPEVITPDEPFITIGESADGVELIDLNRLIETRLLINANSGGGKSYTLRRILEQTHGKIQQFIIDPEGEFHTLRESLDYVLVSANGSGDVQACPYSAGLLAQRLMASGRSAILDIYELVPEERLMFVGAFINGLVNSPREAWHPCLVVVDEAHLFCPQVGKVASSEAIKDLMTRGRKRGLCGILATQRLSKLHKDAAAECCNLMVGRTSQDIDIKRAADLLGFDKEQRGTLRTLAAGTFYTMGPAISPSATLVKIGPVATTHPKAGTWTAPVTPLRSVGSASLPPVTLEEKHALATQQAETTDGGMGLGMATLLAMATCLVIFLVAFFISRVSQ